MLRIVSSIILMAMTVTCTVKAQAAGEMPAADTVAVIKDAHNVIITECGNKVKVNVKGQGNDTNYHYTYRTQSIKDTVPKNAASSRKDWNLRLPFDKDDNDCSRNSAYHCRWEVSSGGLTLGWQGGTGSDGGLLDMGKSIEIGWQYVAAVVCKPWRNGPYFSLGIGLDWRNYYLKDGLRYCVDSATGIVTVGGYPDGVRSRGSNLNVFSLQLPFMINQYLGHNFSAHLGATLNFNTHASITTSYDNGDTTCEEYYKSLHQRKVSCDFSAMIGWRSINVYVKYMPTSVLKTGYGPQFKPLAVGMSLFF